jgi:hypothetical protein
MEDDDKVVTKNLVNELVNDFIKKYMEGDYSYFISTESNKDM